MIVTHDDLTERQRQILAGDERIVLSVASNVAPGTWGGDVMFLERIGKLRRVRQHISQARDGDFTEFERTSCAQAPEGESS